MEGETEEGVFHTAFDVVSAEHMKHSILKINIAFFKNFVTSLSGISILIPFNV